MKRTELKRKKPMRPSSLTRAYAPERESRDLASGVDIDRVHMREAIINRLVEDCIAPVMTNAELAVVRGYAAGPRLPGRATLRGIISRIDTGVAPVIIPKNLRFESEPYRRLVAGMPCIFCGVVGRSQAAHMNGGGMGTKHDDRLIFPACADGPGYRGCHLRLDQGGEITKEVKRRREANAVLDTIETVVRAGLWLTGMPMPDLEELRRWAQ